MVKDISIYLAGKIQKAHEHPNETYWTKNDQQILSQSFAPHRVHFLNPALRTDDLSDQRSTFGRDMLQVFTSDAVFVDARDRHGLGVGAEMMWAKMNRISVISFSPLGSHYHKQSTSLLGIEVKSWIHPFVENLSDAIVESLEEAAAWFVGVLEAVQSQIKGPEWIQKAMQYYLEEQFSFDMPMIDLAKANKELENRFRLIASIQTTTMCEQ